MCIRDRVTTIARARGSIQIMKLNCRQLLPIAVSLVCGFLVACRKPAAPAAGQAILIRNATVINPGTSSVLPSTSILVVNGKIQAVAPAAQLSAPEGALVVDGTGKYLIPGLWDMHVHTDMGDWIPGATQVTFPLFVANGVTGIRTMGDELPTILQWRDAIAPVSYTHLDVYKRQA